jgi:hypothetical protein
MLFASKVMAAKLWHAHRCRARFSTGSKAPQKLTIIMAPSSGLPKLETFRQGQMPRDGVKKALRAQLKKLADFKYAART